MRKSNKPIYGSLTRRALCLLLTAVLLLSLMPSMGIMAFAEDKEVVLKESFAKKADPVSANVANEADGIPVTTAYNGRIWTDKSVSKDSISFKNYNGESNITVETQGDEFSVALSALAQAYEEINLLGRDGEVTVNVALVVDTSTSMNSNYMTKDGVQISRMALMRQAGVQFLDQLRVYAAEGKTVNLSVMSYCGDGTLLLDWTNINESTYTSAKTAIEGLKQSNIGNTNCEAGLAIARWLYDEGYDTDLAGADLRDPLNECTKNYVLFMTDGAPNRSYKDQKDSSSFSGVEGAYVYKNGRVNGTAHNNSVITNTITATDYRKRAAEETLVQCQKLHDLTVAPDGNTPAKLNNLTFMCVGLGEWFTGDQYDTAFPTAVNLLSLCSAVGNGNAFFSGETAPDGLESYTVYPYDVRGNMNPVAAVTLGEDIPYYTMYGNNPAYPDFTYNNYANWKAGGSYSFANNSGAKTAFKDIDTTKATVNIYGTTYTVTLKEAVDLLDRYNYAELGYASALEYRKSNGITEISAQLSYAGQYMFGATNAADLTNAFDSMAKIIYNAYNMVNYNVIETEGSVHIPELKAALQMTDEIGEFMQVGVFRAVVYQDVLYDGSDFARIFTPIARSLADGVALTHGQQSNLEIYQVMLQNNFCEGTQVFPLTALEQILVGAYRAGDLYYNTAADFGCLLKWYAMPGTAEKTYLYAAPYYTAEGVEDTSAEGYITTLYGMYGSVRDSSDSSHMQMTNLMYLCVGYTKNRTTKEQTVLFYVPSSMVPVRLLNHDSETGIATINAHESSDPIHLVYTVRMLTDINYNDEEYVLYCQNPANRNYDENGVWDGTVNFYTNKWYENAIAQNGLAAQVSSDGSTATDANGKNYTLLTYGGEALEQEGGIRAYTDGESVFLLQDNSLYEVERNAHYGGEAEYTPLGTNPYYRSQYDILLLYHIVKDSSNNYYIAVPDGDSTIYYHVDLMEVVLKYLDLYGNEVSSDYFYANDLVQGTPAGVTEVGYYPAMFNPLHSGIPDGAYFQYTWYDSTGNHTEYQLVSDYYDTGVPQVFYNYNQTSGVSTYFSAITAADGSYQTAADGGYTMQSSGVYSYRDGQIFTSGSGMNGQIAIGYLPRDTHMSSARLDNTRMKSENVTQTLADYYTASDTLDADGSITERAFMGNNGKLAVKTAPITVYKEWQYSDGEPYTPGEGSYITVQLFATAVDSSVQSIADIPTDQLQAVSDQVDIYYNPDCEEGWCSYTWRFAQATVNGVEMRQYIVKEVGYHLVTDGDSDPEAIFEPTYVVPLFDAINLLYLPGRITNTTARFYTQDAGIAIDYGLPVQAHPLEDQALPEGSVIRTITAEPVELSYDNGSILGNFTKTPRISDGVEPGDTLELSFGTAQITDDDVLTYTPDTLQMTGKDVIYFEAEAQNHYGNSYYFTGKLTVIPATVMYYEDNFGGITFDAPTTSAAQWATVGEDTTTVQDEDRIGAANNPYGYDSHYEFFNRYSGGSATAVTVNSGDARYATATFDVTGTAFDIIATTKAETGLARVDIYRADGSKVKAVAVDTYYGYSYSAEEQTRLAPDGTVMYEQTMNPETGLAEYILDENGERIPQTTHWIPNMSATGGLFQIPIIKYEFPEYGQYHIVVTVAYSKAFDVHYDASLSAADNCYDFELDAIRVYNPAGYDAQSLDSDIYAAYAADMELEPVESEVRDQLIANNGFGTDIVQQVGETVQPSAKKKQNRINYEDDFIRETAILLAQQEAAVPPKKAAPAAGAGSGVVFIDGVSENYVVSELDFEDFQKYGPKNEVYLAKAQAVAFNMTADKIPADVQISVKTILGTETKGADKSVVTFASMDGSGNPTMLSRTVDTASDQYMSIGDILSWIPDGNGGYVTAGPVVFTSTGESIVSITNIKYTTAPAVRAAMLRTSYDAQVVNTAGELVTKVMANSEAACQFGDWRVFKEPTCTTVGQKERSCIWCGKAEVETIEMLPHTYEAAATGLDCDGGSTTTYVCTVCGEAYTHTNEQGEGHEWKTITTSPSCTGDGYTVRTCLTCGLREVETIPAVGHKFENGTCIYCGNVGSLTDSINWDFTDGVLTISGIGSIPDYTNQNNIPWYSFSSEIQSIVIEEGIIGIGRLAFYHTAAETVTLPGTLRTVGAYAFSNCTKLTEINLPDGLVSIGLNAFVCCTKLQKLTVPATVNSIAENILFSCKKCTVYGYENSLADSYCKQRDIPFVSIGLVSETEVPPEGGCAHDFINGVCSKCGITGGELEDNEVQWTLAADGLLTVSGSGAMSDYAAGESPWFKYRGTIRKVAIAEGVTNIGKLAFYGCSLREIQLPESITEIASFAFSTCPSLETIDLPASVRSIGDNVFVGCVKLGDVTVRNSDMTIGKRAFLRCELATLVAADGSVAQAYAEANGLSFRTIE